MAKKIYVYCKIIILLLLSVETYSQGLEHEIKADLRFEVQYRNEYGNLKIESYYKSGELDSIYRAWNTSGELITEGYYQKGQKNGYWTEWLSNSSNYDFIKYLYKEGKLLNVYMLTSFYDDTTLISNKTYISYLAKGERTEKSLTYNRSGNLVSEEVSNYDKDGNYIEYLKAWDENGVLFLEENIKNRKQHGVQKEWDAEGNLILEEYYDMGKLIKKVK